MSYLARLKRKITENEAGYGATKGTKGAFDTFVASVVAPFNPISSGADPIVDQAAEARRQRTLEVLSDNPGITYAVLCDGKGNPVPVAVAIRGVGTCEVLVPRDRYDGLMLLDILERHNGTVH